MAKIIQQLHVDHINTAKMLNILQQQLDLLAQGDDIDYGVMLDIMTYMTQYPDLYHHPKEDLLFEKMLERDKNTQVLVEELGFEHRSIIRSGIVFLEALRGAAVDILQRRDKIVEEGRIYIQRQQQHMNKEEGEVFPKLTETLNSADWEALDQLVDNEQDPLFGKVILPQYRQRYQNILRYLDENKFPG